MDAESAEESASVVGVVGEAVGVAADPLGEHVGVLDASVRRVAGVVVGEDLVSPPVDGPGETHEFGHVGVRAVGEGLVEAPVGVCLVTRGVHLSEELLGQDRSADFAVGIAGGEHRHHPGDAIRRESFEAGEQHAPRPVQRVCFVAGGGLLHAAADVADRAVREAHRVEVVDDERVVGEMLDQRGAVTGDRVQGGERDRGAPLVVACGESSAEHVTGPAGNHIEEPVAIQVDDLGRVRGVVLGGGVAEPFLVHADRPHVIEVGRVVDRRVGAVRDRRVRGVPPHAELAARRGDRRSTVVDHLGETSPSPLGHRRPRRDRIDVFGPRRHVTRRLGATQPATREDQHRRPARDRQTPHRRAGPAMPDRPRTTTRTTDEVDGGLHVQPPLPADQLVRSHHEPGHPDQRGRALTTVDHGQGSLLPQTLNTCRMAKPLTAPVDPKTRPPNSPHPTLHRGEPDFNRRERRDLGQETTRQQGIMVLLR